MIILYNASLLNIGFLLCSPSTQSSIYLVAKHKKKCMPEWNRIGSGRLKVPLHNDIELKCSFGMQNCHAHGKQ